MNILSPRVAGPLSECNRSVIVTNTIPGATITLEVTRAGSNHVVGKASATNSRTEVPLDPAEDLIAGDVVNARQKVGTDTSPLSTDGPSVQLSVADFHAPEVLSHLYSCSRGFVLGGMRPGTDIQILQAGSVIGTGKSIDGTAAVSIPNGLPGPPTGLVARQLICGKPPPPPPGTSWAEDSPLPAILPLRFSGGQTMPAPSVDEGLTACSRAVHVSAIEPGAEVVLEGTDRGWWAWLGPSDQGSAWIPLPVALNEGEKVSARHDVAPTCELKFERKPLTVGRAQKLGQPGLDQIPCNLAPIIHAGGLKPEADVEFSVTTNGTETTYRTVATGAGGLLPAPPMQDGSIVKVRQGECDVWSDWSPTETAHTLAHSPTQPKISHHVFACQDAIPVENLSVKAGLLIVVSGKHGELARVPVTDMAMVVSVAPSFAAPDNVWVEHQVCGHVARSNAEAVRSAPDVSAGTIRGPLYDGDGSVTVDGVTAGALLELWEASANSEVIGRRAPFDDSGRASITFSPLYLYGGWQLYAKMFHCGQYSQTNPVPVTFHAPALTSLAPASVVAGSAALTLAVKGKYFRSGAKVRWSNSDRPTTFVSSTELHAAISKADVATAANIPVSVVNPDGQTSGPLSFSVSAPPATGYDELLIQNCNVNYIPNTNTHRPVNIYYRLAGSGPGSWVPINDSPHNADYDASGLCPSSPNAGARFALDDGKTYDVVCVDPYLQGCQTGTPDEPACQRLTIMGIHGKTGGGVKVVQVN